MKNKTLQKMVLSLVTAGIILGSTANCFGKFSLVRKVYAFNDSINIGSGIVNKFIKTIIFYLLIFMPVYGIAGFVDLIILNLIEFWTGSNPVALSEYDNEGKFTKSFQTENGKLELTYTEFGKKMKLSLTKDGKNETIFFLKEAPGKVFEEKKGELVEVSVESKKVGEMLLLKRQINGKVESNMIIGEKEFRAEETRVLQNL